MLTLVLGGARSGKSRYAESLCGERTAVYIATAVSGEDTEMRIRIDRHRAMRPRAWTTVEEPLEIAAAVRNAQPEEALVLVDCITVWISNLLWEYRGQDTQAVDDKVLGSIDALIAATSGREVIVVSNEVGTGIVPHDALGRLFRDIQGFANQRLAHAATRVVWLVAGLPQILKNESGTASETAIATITSVYSPRSR